MIQIQTQSGAILRNFKSQRKMYMGNMCREWSRTKSLHGSLGNKPESLQSISNFGWYAEGKILARSQRAAWLPLASVQSLFDPQCMKEAANSSVLLGRREGLHHFMATLSDAQLSHTRSFQPSRFFSGQLHLVLIHVEIHAVIEFPMPVCVAG